MVFTFVGVARFALLACGSRWVGSTEDPPSRSFAAHQLLPSPLLQKHHETCPSLSNVEMHFMRQAPFSKSNAQICFVAAVEG